MNANLASGDSFSVFRVPAMAWFVKLLVAIAIGVAADRRITLKPPLTACEAQKGAKPSELDCPEAANEKDFYDCVQKSYGQYEWNGQMAVAMLKRLCSDVKAKKTHGLVCTSTPFWQTEPCEFEQTSLRFPIVGDWGGTETKKSKLDEDAEDAKPPKGEIKKAGGSRLLAVVRDLFALDSKGEINNVGGDFAQLLIGLNAKFTFDFILNVGDNIYPDGIISEGMRDKQFKAVFKEFENLAPVWYSSIGNHDDFTTGSKEQELKYTTHDETGRWILPWMHYTFTYKLKDPARRLKDTIAHFIVADTVALCGHRNTGPRITLTEPEWKVQTSDAEIKWLDDELNSAVSKTADFLFVVGHYQPYSIRKAADNFKCMVDYFGADRLGQLGVSAYISGHQHLLQHFKFEVKIDGKTHRIDYVLSGEGSNIYKIEKADRDDKRYKIDANNYYHGVNSPEQSKAKVKPGLIHVELKSDAATFYFAGADSKKELHSPIVLPKRPSP